MPPEWLERLRKAKGPVTWMPITPEMEAQREAAAAEEAKARAAIDAMMDREQRVAGVPAAPAAPAAKVLVGSVSSKTWIANAAKRMKVAENIPPGILKTDFAKELARQMQEAAETDLTIRPIKWPSIANQLVSWKLWPPELIDLK